MSLEPSTPSSGFDDEVAALLANGPLEMLGRLSNASNLTLLCRVAGDGPLVVYKPERGETPLWDFPPRTLHRREVAAYVLDRGIGGGMVPPTVLRADGPLGGGSVQLFVEHDPAEHYFALLEEAEPDILAQLTRMVVFDLVTNNADRKGSHVLLDPTGRIRLIDHGVCFNTHPKLRTVAWDFVGDPIDQEARAVAAAVAERLALPSDPLTVRLCELLAPDEVAATLARARRVLGMERFPPPASRRAWPWPPL